jgi:hypothetical protein
MKVKNKQFFSIKKPKFVHTDKTFQICLWKLYIYNLNGYKNKILGI